MNQEPNIQVLDTDVVNQIAAGEVVERPSHLVKELVENSIDAGATEISIDFANGGRDVTVTDNGHGMSQENLIKSLKAHATSKIRTSDDLWSLQSFGFRGEALSSIAAVSQLTISSKSISAKLGARVCSDFGKIQAAEGLGHAQGTCVQVKSLFENVPARLKFLKSSGAEGTQIKNVIKAMALAQPQIEFRLSQESQNMQIWLKADRLSRSQQILEIDELYEGFAERDSVKAHAIFTQPGHIVKSSRQIWLFAQNRWIQDRSLQAAVMEAYRNLLMHGEFPSVAVWVSADPSEIDVNIHPTKSQVKFADNALAFRAVQAAIRDVLEKAPWNKTKKSNTTPVVDYALGVHQALQNNNERHSHQVFKFNDSELHRVQYQQKPQMIDTPHFETPKSFVPKMPTAPVAATGVWSKLQVLGQADLTYLICQSDQGLLFVDQHAAHERVLFEKLMAAWRGGKIDVQDFLFPLVLDLQPDRIEALLQAAPGLNNLGLEFELLGPGSLGLKSAPALLKESALVTALDKMSQEILEHGVSFQVEKKFADLCASMACHSAIRAGQSQTLQEMQSLLQQMDEFPLSGFCPHGRPVSVEYAFHELERDFGRIP